MTIIPSGGFDGFFFTRDVTRTRPNPESLRKFGREWEKRKDKIEEAGDEPANNLTETDDNILFLKGGII